MKAQVRGAMLAKAGHDVLFVGDVMPSASDEDVLAKAESEGRILISDDKDFGELVVPEKRLNLAAKILSGLEVKGKLVIVKEGRVRIRQLQALQK